VVSTSVGAEGLVCSPGENILLADDPETFAAACLDLLASRERRLSLACAGRRLVETRFDWTAVASTFQNVLEQTAAIRTRRPCAVS